MLLLQKLQLVETFWRTAIKLLIFSATCELKLQLLPFKALKGMSKGWP